jgi:hypothetical protein
MLHDSHAVVEPFALETPKPSFSQPSSVFTPNMISTHRATPSAFEWDWDLERADRQREAKADSAVHGAQPFLVDRNLLRDVIKEKLDCQVGRITFLSSGACTTLCQSHP